MLLQALYEYGKAHPDSYLPEGCKLKNPKAIIHLTSDAEFVGVSKRDKGAGSVVCPSIFNEANNIGKCDPYVVNEATILGLAGPPENPQKFTTQREFFMNMVEDTKDENPDVLAVIKAMKNDETMAQIVAALDENKVKPIDMVSFTVDGRSIHDDPRTIAYWQKHRGLDKDDPNGKKGLCFITGETTTLAKTLHKTVGLASVGGISSGDVLASFDKGAFRSYGLDKSDMAPMGEKAGNMIVDVLNTLIQDAPQIAGTKFIHWYKDSMTPEDDIFNTFMDITFNSEMTDEEKAEKERDAMARVQSLFDSITDGQDSGVEALNNVYHILILSAYSGRVVIRRYEEGSYRDLVKAIHSWYEDTTVVNVMGTGESKHYKLLAMLMGIMEQPRATKLYDQMGKEFAGVLPSIMNSIMKGKPIPDAVARKALLRTRSDLLSAKPKEGAPASDRAGLPLLNMRALQWLTAYVRREERKNKEVITMSALNPNHENPAYHCGRLLAQYGQIQLVASNYKVKETVVQKYYSKMSSNPARVVELMDNLSVHHLAKIGGGLANILQTQLNEIYESLGNKVPAELSLKDRAYFALGYHHQLSENNRLRAERKQNVDDSSEASDIEE